MTHDSRDVMGQFMNSKDLSIPMASLWIHFNPGVFRFQGSYDGQVDHSRPCSWCWGQLHCSSSHMAPLGKPYSSSGKNSVVLVLLSIREKIWSRWKLTPVLESSQKRQVPLWLQRGLRDWARPDHGWRSHVDPGRWVWGDLDWQGGSG